MSEIYGTFSTAYVEAMRLRLSALEPENKDLRARVAELEAREKQACEDEEWAHLHAVPIHRRGHAWVAEHFDGHRILEAASASIHGALRALREKVEANP